VAQQGIATSSSRPRGARLVERSVSVDWHRADIMAALRKTEKRWTLRGLSLSHHLHASACERALRRPYPRAEQIIAAALGLQPQTIWPSRYEPDGSPRRRRRTHATPTPSQSTARGALCNGGHAAEIRRADGHATGSLCGSAIATTPALVGEEAAA
jgi:Ner family transcriptional regulator